MSTPRSRQPSGTPTGGQFAETTKDSSGLSLTGRDEQDGTEEYAQRRAGEKTAAGTTMDRIALLLGQDDEWDGSADYLDDIAARVEDSGRPKVGDREEDEYMVEFDTYRANRGGPTTLSERKLDDIAIGLATSPEWGPDELDWISETVGSSGRPHPGNSSGDGYREALLLARDERKAGGE